MTNLSNGLKGLDVMPNPIFLDSGGAQDVMVSVEEEQPDEYFSIGEYVFDRAEGYQIRNWLNEFLVE